MDAEYSLDATVRVTHRYQFYASHRLHAPELSEDENNVLYGKCNNPFGHGHNYVLEVSFLGIPDPQTGLLANRSTVDELVRTKVLKLFDHRNINKDVPELAALVPTTENVALTIAGILDKTFVEAFPGGPLLTRVHVQETDRNGFEVLVNRHGFGREPLLEAVDERSGLSGARRTSLEGARWSRKREEL